MGDDFDYWPKVSPDEKKKEDVVKNAQLDDDHHQMMMRLKIRCGSLQR